MIKTYIKAVGTANPATKIAQAQISQFMAKAVGLNAVEERRLRMIYRATAIDFRHSVIEDYGRIANFDFFPDNERLEPFPTTAQRMKMYEKYAIELAMEAINNCLANKNLIPKITHLITVSCTGMYAPGIDIEIVERLGLSFQTQRTCINFMGCYAAFNALKVADMICKATPEASVLIVDVELCTIHFQKENTEDQLLANAIFADGAAALLLGTEKGEGKAMSLEAFHCDLAPQGKSDMAWYIRDFGFEMRLSSYVPNLLETKMKELTDRLLQKLNLQIGQIDAFAIHPGGKRILEVAEKCLKISPIQNQYSYQILRNFGNMSSATVLFVLKNIWDNCPLTEKKEGNILSMAFGPGLTIESALLKLHI
ncbi:MAG: type III polyketide synthase [Cytophagales bacterium]|nr:MAG: type III polyketide synthase [Cytophagales bacterium]